MSCFGSRRFLPTRDPAERGGGARTLGKMRHGFVLPGGSAREQLEQAVIAESAGWDGVFVWEAAYGVDAWTLLAAMAARTSRIQLGTMLTPLPWRRPWKVASQAVTLDELSGGRAILAVGLGAVDTALGNTGEVTDRRARAELLDEGIDLVAGLWAGELSYAGRHYQMDLTPRTDLAEVAQPVRRPRIPIWVVGAWPRPKSMRRVLRCDGLLPICMDGSGYRATTPEDIRAMAAWLDDHGGRRPGFDIIMEGETPADDADAAAEIVRPWSEAGCTWWLDARWELPHHGPDRSREVRRRLEAGPPPV
jgi:alkanesulfonate monooxygenase SsuD/methylene tetrahydromethanopterin reductase-like flavin-dependent oxidoreductase (luciferase family)